MLSAYTNYAPSLPFLPSAPTVARWILPRLPTSSYTSAYTMLSSYVSSLTGAALPDLNDLPGMLSNRPDSLRGARQRSARARSTSTGATGPGDGFAELLAAMGLGIENWNAASVVMLLGTLYMGWLTINYVRRMIWGWVMLFVRLGIWGAVVAMGLYVWGRGGENAMADVAGGAQGLWDFFLETRRNYGEENQNRRGPRAQTRWY